MQTKVTWKQGPFVVEVTSNQAVNLIAGRISGQIEALREKMPDTPVTISAAAVSKVQSKRTNKAKELLAWLQDNNGQHSRSYVAKMTGAPQALIKRMVEAGELELCEVFYISGGGTKKRMHGVWLPGTAPTLTDDVQHVLGMVKGVEKPLGRTSIERSAEIPKTRALAALDELIQTGVLELRNVKLDSGFEYDGVFLTDRE